jgi:tetratricopeptide (TPR) repeat protein/tRNA A-37 threonylcarbamoyl transferase component Bud32
MRCPLCHNDVPAGTSTCACGYSFSNSPTVTIVGSEATEDAESSPTPPRSSLAAGQLFDDRYRINKLLGVGGMGAVYQAWDEQLGIAVAIKTIRHKSSSDPASAGQLDRRFKRELILARQISHKNIVRIHDLGEVNGIKYLTMALVQGTDLSKMLKRDGRLSLERTLRLARQMVAGLAAAHEAGVVHRDLKPANIMIDDQDHLQIMDFGIATSVATGATTVGGMIGTVQYMAPEQLNGLQADQRSDIYALGLVLYEMLAGREIVAKSATSVGALVSHRQHRPESLRSHGLPVPDAFNDIIMRCLEPNPVDRFESAGDLEAALAQLDASGHRLAGPVFSPAVTSRRPAERGGRGSLLRWAAAIVVLALAGAVGWRELRSRPARPSTPDPVTVLIAEFENRANDPVFDGVVEQALGVALESASFITTYPRRGAMQVATEVRPGSKIDESLARIIALREGIQIVIPGEITERQGRYAFTIKALDAASGRVIVTATGEAAGKGSVLDAVGKLAATIRRALGDAKPESAQTAAAETFTAASLEAAHAYATAQEAFYSGKTEEAIKAYNEAIARDPAMGRAYAGLAAVYQNLGQRTEADKYYKLALARLDRMTERERLRTRGVYYVSNRDPKAIEELSSLVKAYPNDSQALANLALAIFYTRDMTRALEEGRRAAAIYPKNVIRRNNVALYAMYAGEFVTAERVANSVLQLNPAFPKAFIAIALSQLAQGRRDQARATYRKLAGVSPAGASYAAAGLADLALVDGNTAVAASTLEPAIARDVEAKNLDAAAGKQVTLASVQFELGRKDNAARMLETALGWNRDPSVLFLAGHLDVEMGRREKALAIAGELEKSVEADPVAYGLLLRGEVRLAANDPRGAFDLFEQAKKRADTWFGRFDSGLANLRLGRSPAASSDFDLCLKRRGEATALFLDEIPTYRFFPPLYYYMGLAKEGLENAAGAAESYRTFLAIKQIADPAADPLVRDARARLAR